MTKISYMAGDVTVFEFREGTPHCSRTDRQLTTAVVTINEQLKQFSFYSLFAVNSVISAVI